MNRILFERGEIRDGRATFSDVRAEHVLNVLHGAEGQTLKTGVLDGPVGTSVIERIEGNAVTVRCTHESPSLQPWLDLILAPPRPRAMKRLLPQLASLGVRRIVLVGAEKVEKAFWGAQLLKPEIYRPLLIEGLMQGAVSTQLPEIHQEKRFSKWLSDGDFAKNFECQPFRIVAHPPQPGTVPISSGTVPVFAIGPEGGWTDGEVALLEAQGFVRHSLGPRILKTETATIALLSRFIEFTLQDHTRKE